MGLVAWGGERAGRRGQRVVVVVVVLLLLRYGDCVAGLLWAELGDRLGLQLPGGAPLDRAPVAPLSRPSEFSNISWMRGGMEPGISIFRVMTRSAPGAGRERRHR